MPEIHSKLSPSASDRWLACPGSLLIEAESTASEYAAQGTVAHALASHCYLTGEDPALYLDQPRSCDGYTITIDQEMIEGVQLYLDFLESIPDRKLIEQRIEHCYIPGLGGTVDCAIPGMPAIVDFKYGAGVAVEADNNTQLGCYALLMINGVLRHDQIIEGVELIVVQPRSIGDGEKVKRWFASTEWLLDLQSRIERVATGERNDELHAGPHCRWCPARAQCPVLHEATVMTAMQEFRRAEEVIETPSGPVSITPQSAVQILALEEKVTTYFEAVRAWAHNQAEKGVEIPGYKLVSRVGNRRITDAAKAEKLLKKVGIGKKQLYKSEMLSPAQIEKLLSKEHKPLVDHFTERSVRGTALVPISDKREAVKRLTAMEMFANAEGEN